MSTVFYASGEDESQDIQQQRLAKSVGDPDASLPEKTLGEDAAGTWKNERIGQPLGGGLSAFEINAEKNEIIASQKVQAAHLERQAAQQEARSVRLAQNGATEQSEMVARRAANSELAADIARRSTAKFNWTKFGAGLGIGIAAAIGNFLIERDANEREGKLFDNVLDEFKKIGVRNKDSQRGINIVAD